MTERTWTKKTLAKQLAGFLRDDQSGLTGQSTINDLIDALKSAIVEQEVGENIDIFSR